MRISYIILSCTDLLLMAVTLLLGLVAGAHAPDSPPIEPTYTKHVLLGVASLLFTGFVHVLCFTYFAVQVRLAQDAVAAKVVPMADGLTILHLKRQALRWLVAGFLTVLITGVAGALVTAPPAFNPLWHMMLAFTAFAANTCAFVAQTRLISRNKALFDRLYPAPASR